jgi:hypothetical protein
VAESNRQLCTRNPDEAFQELLNGGLDYSGESSPVRPYKPECLSLPSGLSAPISLIEVSDPHAQRLLVGYEELLLSETWVQEQRRRECPIVPYWDVSMRTDRTIYLKFLRQLKEARILGATRNRRGTVTPFCVAKKDHRLRLVLDCRAVNQLFRHAPRMELAPPEMLANLSVEPGKQVFLAIGDITNCFYQFALPLPLQDFFCMPGVSHMQRPLNSA